MPCLQKHNGIHNVMMGAVHHYKSV